MTVQELLELMKKADFLAKLKTTILGLSVTKALIGLFVIVTSIYFVADSKCIFKRIELEASYNGLMNDAKLLHAADQPPYNEEAEAKAFAKMTNDWRDYNAIFLDFSSCGCIDGWDTGEVVTFENKFSPEQASLAQQNSIPSK